VTSPSATGVPAGGELIAGMTVGYPVWIGGSTGGDDSVLGVGMLGNSVGSWVAWRAKVGLGATVEVGLGVWDSVGDGRSKLVEVAVALDSTETTLTTAPRACEA
jgi:hypothetical protein